MVIHLAIGRPTTCYIMYTNNMDHMYSMMMICVMLTCYLMYQHDMCNYMAKSIQNSYYKAFEDRMGKHVKEDSLVRINGANLS